MIKIIQKIIYKIYEGIDNTTQDLYKNFTKEIFY